MQRRRYLGLVGATATGGCLRLQNEGQTTDSDGPVSETTGQPVDVTSNWPQYGYDAANSGSTTATRGPTGDVDSQWVVSGGTATGITSSPAIADGRAYFTSSEDSANSWAVRAVDANTGEIDWQQPIEGTWDQSPVVTDGQVFVCTNRGMVVALDAATGSYNWEITVDESVTSWNRPTVSGDVVHVTTETGSVYALSTVDGSEIGQASFDGRCLSGPAFAGGRVFVTTYGPTDDSAYPDEAETFHFFAGAPDGEPVSSLVEMDGSGTVHMISPSEGGVQWEVDLPEFVVATPTVVDSTVYIGCWDGYLYALDAATGNREWRHEVGTPISGSASVFDDTVYVGGWDGSLYAIGTDGSRKWLLPTPGTKITSKPAVADGVVYASVDDGPVVAVGTDGTRRWRFDGPVGDYDQSAPAVADDALFVCGDVDTEPVDGDQRDVGGLFKLA